MAPPSAQEEGLPIDDAEEEEESVLACRVKKKVCIRGLKKIHPKGFKVGVYGSYGSILEQD